MFIEFKNFHFTAVNKSKKTCTVVPRNKSTKYLKTQNKFQSLTIIINCYFCFVVNKSVTRWQDTVNIQQFSHWKELLPQ